MSDKPTFIITPGARIAYFDPTRGEYVGFTVEAGVSTTRLGVTFEAPAAKPKDPPRVVQ